MLQRTTFIAVAGTVIAFAVLLFSLPTGNAPDASLDSATGNEPSNSFVINNVRVFDGKEFLESTQVVVKRGVVTRVGNNAGTNVDAEVIDGAVIDGEGMTLLPGLFDAHTHSYGAAQRDAVRFGVTTLLDMFTAPALLSGQRSMRDGFGPSNKAALFSAGMLATVDGGHGTQFGIPIDVIESPDDATEWVANRKAEGSDYIKLVYIPNNARLPSLDYASARAVIDAAHAADMLAVVHIDTLAAASEMLEAGVDGFVHIFADAPASDAFIAAASEAGVFVIPTLSIIAMVDGRAPGKALADDDQVAPYLSDLQRNNLGGDFGGRIPGYSLDIALDNVRRLHAAGVPILAGSDAPNPGTAHGATLHHELLLLTRAGLSNSEALASATSLPAQLFSAAGRGTIAPGSRADLVMVGGNPDDDIHATRAVDAVFRNGYRINRAADARGPASERALPELLGDFSDGLEPANGLVWATTSDEMMGGGSSAVIAVNAAGALAVDTTISSAFPYPWAGAYLAVIPEGSTMNASEYVSIAFDVRGTAARYRLMIFVADAYGTPPTAEFEVTGERTRIVLPMADFGAIDWGRLTGLAIVAPMQSGDYDFEIDNVKMLR